MKPYYEDEKRGIVIYCGDAREVLPGLGSVDLILTDPPYGIGADRNLRANKQHGKAAAPSRDYGVGAWDSTPPSPWMFGLIGEKARYQIIWGGNYFPLPPSQCWLVWDKLNGDNGYADCELAWTNLPKAVRMIQWRWAGMLQQHMSHKEPRCHPTQKPLGVMKWALSQAPEDCRTVADPYMGSGTTLVAAKCLGRRCIGIEISEAYCAIAARRLEQEVFDFAPEPEPAAEQMKFGT